MTAQKGKDLLIKMDQGRSFVTLAGLRAKRLAFNTETVDITDAGLSGRWRELLGGSGVQRASLSGIGKLQFQILARSRALFKLQPLNLQVYLASEPFDE